MGESNLSIKHFIRTILQKIIGLKAASFFQFGMLLLCFGLEVILICKFVKSIREWTVLS